MNKLPFVGKGTQGLDSESHHLCFGLKGLAIFLAFCLILINSLPSAFAWWNSDWDYRKEITLNTSGYLAGNVANDHIIPIKQTGLDTADFWTHVGTKCFDVRFVKSDDLTEMDYYIEQCNATDGNFVAWVEFTDQFTSAANVSFYMYYGNAAAADGQDFTNTFPATYTIVWDFNESSGTTAIDKTSNTYDLAHQNTPTMGQAGKLNGDINYSKGSTEWSSNNTLWDDAQEAFSVSTWISFGATGWTDAKTADEYFINKTNAGGNAIFTNFQQADGKFRFYPITNGSGHTITSAKTSWAANTWFNIIMTFDSVGNTMALYVNGSTADGGTLAEAMDALQAGSTSDFTFASDGGGANSMDVNADETIIFSSAITSDEAILLYRSQNFDLQNIGAETTEGAAAGQVFDLNISKLDGYSFSRPMRQFAYAIDGNLRIDFNIFDNKNYRHTIALYYNDINITEQGIAAPTGTAIVTDWNLNTGDCDSLDWYASPVGCHWDWNIHRSFVPDGNYVLEIKSGTDFNISHTDFNIANDVNLLIKKPIDEDTGLPIDTDAKYRWEARISDSSGLRIYTGQIDQNGFILPIGESISIEIDTNTSDYFARTYSYNYTAAQAFDELQPYLVPQEDAGNFIFNVVDSITIAPIEDVEIRIYGTVAGTGSTGLQTITTDSAGLATIPLRLDTTYTVYFYYNSTLMHTATIAPTTASLFYQVSLNITSISIPPKDVGAIKVLFEPTTPYALRDKDGRLDLNAMIYIVGKTIQSIRIQVFDSNNCRYDDNSFGGTWTDGNKVSFMVDTNHGGNYNILYGFDCNLSDDYSVYLVVDVNSTDGNQFSLTSVWWRVPPDAYNWDLLYRLSYLLPKELNLPGTKTITSIIAMIMVFSFAGVTTKLGGGDSFVAALLCLGILGFFVYIGWVEFLPFVFVSIAALFISFYMEAR